MHMHCRYTPEELLHMPLNTAMTLPEKVLINTFHIRLFCPCTCLCICIVCYMYMYSSLYDYIRTSQHRPHILNTHLHLHLALYNAEIKCVVQPAFLAHFNVCVLRVIWCFLTFHVLKPPSPLASTDTTVYCSALPLASTATSTTPHLSFAHDGEGRQAVSEGTSSHMAPPAQNPTPTTTRTKV